MKRFVITSRRRGIPLLAVAVVASPMFIAALLYADGTAHAKSPRLAKTVWDSVYSANQAARGETAYTNTCARCHKASLGGADESPALTGSAFLANWNGKPFAISMIVSAPACRLTILAPTAVRS